MHTLLRDEIRSVNKAAELRIAELSDMAVKYAAGQLTPEQATDGYYRHADKWGAAIPGVFHVQGVSDQEIQAAMEQAAGPHTTRAENRKRYQAVIDRGTRS